MIKNVVYVFEGNDFEKLMEDETANLLMNMSSGVLPIHLSEQECGLLKEKYGEDWFYKLGYNDEEYEKPNF